MMFLAADAPQDNWLNLEIRRGWAKLPQGWIAAKTGEGPGSVWQVVEDSTAPGGKALAQTSADGPKAIIQLVRGRKNEFFGCRSAGGI